MDDTQGIGGIGGAIEWAAPEYELRALEERVAQLEKQVRLLAKRFVGSVTTDEMRDAGFEI